MKRWYLVYCKPQQDHRAQTNLERQGFDVFRPTINIEKRKVSGETIRRSESLFPRYIFLNIDPEAQSLSPVRSTFGVMGFVAFGKNYSIVPQPVIDDIQKRMENQASSIHDPNMLRDGDKVIVSGHGFSYVNAIYKSECGEGRALILLEFLGKESEVKVPERYLNRA